MWLRFSPSYLKEKTIMSLTNQVTIQFEDRFDVYDTVTDSVSYHHGRCTFMFYSEMIFIHVIKSSLE